MKYSLSFLMILIFTVSVFAGRNYDIGARYYTGKNFEKAKESFLKEVIEVPTNGNAYYFLGEIEKSAGNFSDAENYYRKAVNGQIQKKFLSLAYWNIIVLIEQRNDIGELIKVCREFNQKTGDDSAKRKIDDIINKLMWTDSENAIALYKEGLALKEKNKSDDAKKKFQEALKSDPSFLAAHFELGILLYQAGNMSEASYYLKTVGNKIPYYSAVHLLLGDIYYTNKSYGSAAEEFSLALEYGFFDKQTQFATLVKAAGSCYNLKNYDKAIEYAKNALAINNNDKDTLMLLSAIDIKTEKYNDALESLTKLNALTPNDPDIIYQIGSLYYKQGKEPKSMVSFETLYSIITKDGGQVPVKYIKAMQLLIKQLHAKGEYSKATKVAASIPDTARDYDTNLSTARSYYQMKEYQKAVDFYEKLSLDDEERLNLCRAYTKLGNKNRAKELLAPMIRYNTTLRSKVLADPILGSIAKEIQQTEQKPAPTREPVMPAQPPVKNDTPAPAPTAAPQIK
jgi:tetratricopeptide (TPR) repeat protein